MNEGRYYCKKCFSKNIEDRVKRVIRNFNLVDNGDNIAVALSGGKDSSNTLYILKKIFEKNPKIRIFAIIVDEGFHFRKEAIKKSKKLCEEIGVEYYIFYFKKEVGKTMDSIGRKFKDKNMCSYCGVLRRYLINKKARELKANKIALGHNLDDEVQSIIMNIFKGDFLRMARFDFMPKIRENTKFVPRIKPLAMIPEKESAIYAITNNLPISLSHCPYAAHNHLRMEVKYFLNKLEFESPGIKYSIFNSGRKLAKILKENMKIGEINNCKICGEPSSESVCQACKIIEKL